MAWLDCDVVLRDPDWPSKALAKLEDAILVQPFSSAYEVRLAGKGDPLPASPVGRTRPSFAARYAKRELSPEEIRTWRIGDDPVPIHCGYAWAGRTEPLREHGFYDASILGGGTREFAATAIGEIDSLVQYRPRSPAQLEHFLTWARGWAPAVGGRIDYVEGELLHLWHGETADRGYGKRYEVLTEFDFNLVLAAGATVAGVRSAVIAQNSGLGNLINPLTSLHMTYAIPVLVFMSLRGWPDPRRDEPQHAVMGASTHRLLDAIDVAHWTLNQDATSMVELLDAAEQELAAGRPAFILAEKGDKPHRQPLPGLVSQRRHRRAEHDRYGRRHGLAGLRPTVSGFASIVIGRAAEQIILSIAWPNLPVTIVGHYAGLSGALEGAPHHATTDLAFTRAIPGMRIWTPADDTDVTIVGPLALSG
ncbi:MAG: hypothetical protein ACRDTT_20405, partial [Pseudonocardiaceae bacterium]